MIKLGSFYGQVGALVLFVTKIIDQMFLPFVYSSQFCLLWYLCFIFIPDLWNREVVNRCIVSFLNRLRRKTGRKFICNLVSSKIERDSAWIKRLARMNTVYLAYAVLFFCMRGSRQNFKIEHRIKSFFLAWFGSVFYCVLLWYARIKCAVDFIFCLEDICWRKQRLFKWT